jgi:hypothetical protein
MNESHHGRPPEPEQELMRLWRDSLVNPSSPESLARLTLTQVWKFDQTILWRNFREYAAGLVLLVIFVRQAIWGADRLGALVGVGCVGFVMLYLWWKHRGLQPLDPMLDLAAYREAALARYDAQIHLLETVTSWYLLPLLVPVLWQAARAWPKSPVAAVLITALVLGVYGFLRWLNVNVAAVQLKTSRDNLERMLPKD